MNQNEASVNETISLINSCFIFKEGKITPDYLSIDKVLIPFFSQLV
jgi:hypothetical protein